jgi:hypothetical protein
VIHYDNNNQGLTRLKITTKKTLLTDSIFRQIMPSSGDTIDSVELSRIAQSAEIYIESVNRVFL